MRTAINEKHFSDMHGNPAGGTTFGQGFCIGWQNGPLGRGEERIPANGAFVEDIICAAIGRLEFYQNSKFESPYNASALISLREALHALEARTEHREARGIEGTHLV